MGDISIRNLAKSFGGIDVLKAIDLDVAAGDFTVVLGPSGCGKSTLLRLIAGLERADAGQISIGGRDVTRLDPAERDCAMVFQNYALYPHMTVAENIGYALRVLGLRRSERRRRVAEIAALVELQDHLDRKPAQLSGGQRQRVAMARAIIRTPSVFLFDEPLSNLDAKLRAQMRHEVRRIHGEVGATSVFVTHDQVEAMTLADRLVVMREGAIEQIGAPSEIYEAPDSVYVARFLGSPPASVLPGTLIDCGLRVRLSDGQVMPLDGLEVERHDGSDILVAIRPEALRLATDVEGVQGRLLFSEELGSARLHHLGIAGEVVPMLTSEKLHPAPGDVMRVAPRRQDGVFVFDPETERRLASPARSPVAALAQ